MIDRNEIPFNTINAPKNGEGMPPQSGIDRYKKDELIEFTHQWCDIVEEKIARIRGHLNSGTVPAAQALWYARIFGRYAGLLPTGPAGNRTPATGGKVDVPKMRKVDLETLKRVHPIRDRANGVYSSASHEVDGYNRAIHDLKAKYGELYAEVKE